MTQESSDSGSVPPPLSFANLMALKPLGNAEVPPSQPEKVELFQSLAVPFAPGSRGVAFGGHVYAQSAYAASKTVKAGFVIHVSARPNNATCEGCHSQTKTQVLTVTLGHCWYIHLTRPLGCSVHLRRASFARRQGIL